MENDHSTQEIVQGKSQYVNDDNIKIFINNSLVNIKEAPIIENNCILVPIKGVLESLGASVDWNQDTNMITIKKNDTTILLTIGQKNVYVNNQIYTLDVPAKLINSSTYVPIRFISENLGLDIDWNNKDRAIHIKDSKISPIKDLELHFIDVGQGDSAIIQLPNGTNVMIDCGNTNNSQLLMDYLSMLEIKKIDYLIVTHPHEDHIGAMSKIIETFEIGKIYMPKVVHTTNIYTNLLTTIKNKNLKITEAKPNTNIIDEKDLKFTILAPNSDKYNDLNNYSVVTKLIYRNNSFLFTGDAEKISEDEILKNKHDIKADVLKVGHHGSTTSSSPAFVKAISPKYSIISVGKDNSYNHPDNIIVNRLKLYGEVYRTDKVGTIIVKSDGDNLSIATNKNASSVKENAPPVKDNNVVVNNKDNNTTQIPQTTTVYITNTGKKYHKGSCSYLSKSKIPITLNDAKTKGYGSCSKCKP